MAVMRSSVDESPSPCAWSRILSTALALTIAHMQNRNPKTKLIIHAIHNVFFAPMMDVGGGGRNAAPPERSNGKNLILHVGRLRNPPSCQLMRSLLV
jgi:hypothetical protein